VSIFVEVLSKDKNKKVLKDFKGIKLLTSFFKIRELTIFAVLIFIGFVISLFTPYFLTTDNIMGVARSFSMTAMMAIGMTMVIITGGIDLSVGSVMGLASLITALSFEKGLPVIVCICAGLCVGLIFGLFNGLLITKINLPPFIATLGTLSIGRGLIYIITEGYPRTPDLPKSFVNIGQGYIIFPVPVIIMLILMFIFTIVMSKTRFGRYVYAIGGNEIASKLSGVKTKIVKLKVYILCSLICAIAGIVMYARLNSAESTAGTGAELDVIAAAVIGGASLSGGYGSIMGAVIGASLIGIISNGVVLLSINTYAQQAITGCVILIAVSIDMWRSKKD
jgi:ribose transport system permease protein